MMTAKIGDFDILIVNERPITVEFTAGRKGPEEAGRYAFWAMVLKDPFDVRIIRTTTSVEERVLQFKWLAEHGGDIETREANGWMWNKRLACGANIDLLRPASREEVDFWLNWSPEDAKFIAPEVQHQ